MSDQTAGQVAPFSIWREFDAPRDLVWEVNTRSEHLGRWMGPPGSTVIATRMDFRVGGRHHYGYRDPSGTEMWGVQQYRVIEPTTRLELLQSFSDRDGNLAAHPMAPTWPRQMLSTMTFEDLGGRRTRMTVTWQPWQPDATETATFDAARDGMRHGFGGMFATLDGYLALTSREIVLRRFFAYPASLVWTALTEVEHTSRWWGPDGFRNVEVTMDFVVGGSWRYVMEGLDGMRFPNHVLFTEIVPQSRLAFDHGDGERVWFETLITLEAVDGGTQLTQIQRFPTAAERDTVVEQFHAIEGGKQHFASLEGYLREVLSV